MPLYPKNCQVSGKRASNSKSSNMDTSYKAKCEPKSSKNFVLDKIQNSTESVINVNQSSNVTRGRYSVLSSHRPIAPQNNVSAHSPEGIKALRAYAELRQSATSLYPSTSKTSVFLQQKPDDLQITSGNPFIHMVMTNPPDTFKSKGHPGFVDSVFGNETKSSQTKDLLKNQLLLHQRSSYSEFNPVIRDVSDSGSTTSDTMSNENASPYYSGRPSSGQIFEKLMTDSCIAERMNQLSFQLKQRNAEFDVMKKEMQSIRAIAEESSKEANLSKKLLQNLKVKVKSLEDQIDILEDKVCSQESEILEHLVAKIEESAMRNSSAESLASESLASITDVKEIDQPLKQGVYSINFDKILTNIGDLNRRMDKMQSMQLIYTNDKSGATFKLASPVALILYKNGMVLGDTGFRSFTVDSAKQVLLDICKGYFPSELYTQHPNGIFINVTDKRGVEFKTNNLYSGPGFKLCAVTKVPNLPLESSIDLRANKPDTVSSMESLGFSGQPRFKLVQLPDLCGKSVEKLNDKIIVLKLKHIGNDGGYKMRVSVLTTIEEIIAHLAHFIENDVIKQETPQPENKSSSKISLISSIPFGILSMPHVSLKQYGIQHNTLLYINKAPVH